MEKDAAGKSKRGKKNKNDETKKEIEEIKDALSVPSTVRRFIHLGYDFGPYHAQNYPAHGIVTVKHLGFNHLKAYDLGIISEELVQSFRSKESGTEKKDMPPKEYEKVPKNGWPGPDVVEVVKKLIMNDGGACRPAAIFILAVCARSPHSRTNNAYSVVKFLKSPDDMLLFIKYTVDLAPKQNVWNVHLRNAVKAWYTDRVGAKELAEEITRFRKRHTWSHKDILKQVHVKPKTKVQDLVLKYVLFGVSKAQETLDSIPKEDPNRKEAESILAYLEASTLLSKISFSKRTKFNTPEVKNAVRLIKTHNFYLEHCDHSMLGIPAVWEALLPNLPLNQLLHNLAMLRITRIMKTDDDLSKAVVSYLKHSRDVIAKHNDAEYAGESDVSPALVLISLQTYIRKTREPLRPKSWVSKKDVGALPRTGIRTDPAHPFLANQVTGRRQRTTVRVDATSNRITIEPLEDSESPVSEVPPKPNPDILEALGKLLVASIKAMKPTQKRFIFGVGNIQKSIRCNISPYVMTSEAAALTYMCLEASEPEGSVSAWSITNDGNQCKRLPKAGYSIVNCSEEILKSIGASPVKVDHWITWLSQEKHHADVIVLMTDGTMYDRNSGYQLLKSMKKYRKDLKSPKTKLLLVSLSRVCVPHNAAMKEDDGILMVIGFDSHLPFIIQHFAMDHF